MCLAPVTTVVDCLRHGDVEGGGKFRGITDDTLSAAGWRQMTEQCAGRQWDVVVSSPLRRCREFAEDWTERHKLPLDIESAWSEIDFGDWEGKTAEQIDQQFPGALSTFYADPSLAPPQNSEPYQQFALRIQRAWEHTLSTYAGQRLLLVTHAGPIRALLANVLMITPQNSFHIDVPHACLTRFSCFQNGDNKFVQLNFHKPL